MRTTDDSGDAVVDPNEYLVRQLFQLYDEALADWPIECDDWLSFAERDAVARFAAIHGEDS